MLAAQVIPKLRLTPGMAGSRLTPEEFDASVDGDKDHRYELIDGVLVVSPAPSIEERDPNEELGFLLRLYKYIDKQREYRTAGVVEYWIIDRFARSMTVHRNAGGRTRKIVVREGGSYSTPLLPGFELPLDRLLGVADGWSGQG